MLRLRLSYPKKQAFLATGCLLYTSVLAYLIQADRQSYAPASLELGRLYACGDEEYGICLLYTSNGEAAAPAPGNGRFRHLVAETPSGAWRKLLLA